MLVGQTFGSGDIAAVITLVLLEALLSADNAFVLALLVKHLPDEQRKRALLYGLAGAFSFRLVAIVGASVVLKLWELQAIGAAYLIYLAYEHFARHRQAKEKKIRTPRGFWQTVIIVEITDAAFAIDSIIAGVSFIDGRQSKVWVVYLGAILGILLLRFAASKLIYLLERFPALDSVAYALVGWVGLKLAVLAFSDAMPTFGLPKTQTMPPAVFWSGFAVIFVIGSAFAYFQRRRRSEINPDFIEPTSEEAIK